MSKFYKLITLILLVAMCSSMTLVLADEPYSFYMSFTGKVVEIENLDNGITKVFVEGKDGSPAYFMLSENTYFVDNIKIEKGVTITGFYESGKPMIMIYPPQYSIDIVSPVYEETNVKADKFDSQLISKDKQLKLNLSEDTEILWENNTQIYWLAKPTIKDLETVLANRKLIVFYTITTKSIPAQTTPSKIIVLSQQIEDTINITVNDKIIEAPKPYFNEEGTILIPVRAISEALGYEASWNNDERSVQIGKEYSFKIGENSYYNGETSVSLETSPIINGGITFVPLSFFKDVMKINFVEFLDNNVFINANNIMNE